MYSAFCYGPASLLRWWRGAAVKDGPADSMINEGMMKQKAKLEELRSQRALLHQKRDAARQLYRSRKDPRYHQMVREFTVELSRNEAELRLCEANYNNLHSMHAKHRQNADTLETATLLQETTLEMQRSQALLGRPEDLERVHKRAESVMSASDSFADAISRPLGVSPETQRDDDDIRELEIRRYLEENDDGSTTTAVASSAPLTKSDEAAMRMLYPEKYAAPAAAAAPAADPFNNWHSVQTPSHEMRQHHRTPPTAYESPFAAAARQTREQQQQRPSSSREYSAAALPHH